MGMAADVSRQLKSTTSDGKAGGPGGTGPITRDFLGGCFGIESNKELDLDLHVPFGWEKRLDLKSGNVYIQRCNNPPPPTSPSDHKSNLNQTPPYSTSRVQDLNFSPQPKPTTRSITPSLFEDTNLDLKLVSTDFASSTTTTTIPIGNYQSVCTLDKVKSALDRASRDPLPASSSSVKKRSSPSVLSCSSPSNSSSSTMMSVKESDSAGDCHQGNGLLVAAACPSCLLYVLISKSNPKCPKCNSVVPLPAMTKKPKIDLNISVLI